MNSFYQRRRTIGRASSPPTWACYERITYHDSFANSDSDESDSAASESEDEREGADIDMDVDSDSKEATDLKADVKGKGKAVEPPVPTASSGSSSSSSSGSTSKYASPAKRGRERTRKRHSAPAYTLQPILTIQSSQGFVWNQDLFVPPYVKDRYVVSTSPPGKGFLSSSASSVESSLDHMAIEVVEIRIKEGELDHVFA